MTLAFLGRALCILMSTITVNATLADTNSNLIQPSSSKTFKALYSIPVGDDELKPYAGFAIDDYTVHTAPDGTASLRFTIPDDLVAGIKTEALFQETGKTSTERTLTGAFGTIRCTIPWLGSQCTVEFDRAIVPEFADTMDFILKKYSIGEGWLERLDVLKHFSTEPIGRVNVLELVNQKQ